MTTRRKAFVSFGFILLNWFALLAHAQPAARGSPAEFTACVQFISTDPGMPLTETARVTVRNKLPVPPELRLALAKQLAMQQLWKIEGDISATLEATEELCPAAISPQVSADLDLSAQDFAAAEGQRGSIGDFIKKHAAQIASAVQPPAKPAAGTVWVRVFYGSNRRPVRAPDEPEEAAYATGTVDVTITAQARMERNRTGGLVRIGQVTDHGDITVGTPRLMSLPAWKDALRRRQGVNEMGTLVFIHGYRTSFEAAAKRTAQLAYDLAYPGPAVFFSWPSADRVTSYPSDAREARASSAALSAMLEQLPGTGPIHVVAHSMGNLVLLDALLKLRENAPVAMARIEEVVLAAPDVDTQEFNQNFAPRLLTGKPRYTLYASQHDMALASSEAFQGGQRLGTGGPGLYLRHFLDSVDASSVPRGFFDLNHSYFGDTTTVMSDLFYLIRYRLGPEKRKNLRKIDGMALPAWRFKAAN